MSLFKFESGLIIPAMEKRGICILNAYDILPGAAHFYERMAKNLEASESISKRKPMPKFFLIWIRGAI
jgi:hypothetical protein